MKSLKDRNLKDIAGIAQDIKSKSEEEVSQYLEVLLKRYDELKDRDFIFRKLQSKDFEQINLQTLLDFDTKYKDYAILLQENHYFSR